MRELATVYGPLPARAVTEATEPVMRTCAGSPASISPGMNALRMWIVAIRSVSRTSFQSSIDCSHVLPSRTRPAFDTTSCTDPDTKALFASLPISTGCETSVRTASHEAPAARSAAAASVRASQSTSARTRCLPAAAQRWAMARPMLLAAPVMRATLPAVSSTG
ncbi:MAG TPA: hypothetical protein VGL26_06560 [Jatrophihabitans sp.]